VKTYDDYVAELAIKHRESAAFWHLVYSGEAALPAVRKGLSSRDPKIRRDCTRVLDHLVNEDSWPELIAMVGDRDPNVRAWALHSLACDRCKENSCRPDKDEVMLRAISAMQTDPVAGVRSMAVEVVARWVYDDADAEAAITDVRDSDPDPGVRKKAGWFAPGGVRYEKKKPKSRPRR
jgi:HEAT repeat protein